MICRIASPIAEAVSTFTRDTDNKIPKGKGPSSPAHYCDGLRYVAAFVAANRGDFSDIRRLIVEKRASLRNDRNNQDDSVISLNAGYTSIGPGAVTA